MKQITINWELFKCLVTAMGYRAHELKGGEVSLYGPRPPKKRGNRRGPIKFWPLWPEVIKPEERFCSVCEEGLEAQMFHIYDPTEIHELSSYSHLSCFIGAGFIPDTHFIPDTQERMRHMLEALIGAIGEIQNDYYDAEAEIALVAGVEPLVVDLAAALERLGRAAQERQRQIEICNATPRTRVQFLDEESKPEVQ